MQKLRLEVDDLKVDSFDAGEGAPGAGTVRGLAVPPPDSVQICKLTENDASLAGTCGLECTGTCGNTYGDCCGGSGHFTCQYCYG